jgi:hypothetical protein
MSLIDTLNVAKIDRNAPGDYTIHFQTPMNSATMVCSAIHPTPPVTILNTAATEVRFAIQGTEPEIISVRFDD